MRPRSSTKETRANISLRMPLARREEKMQGDEFFTLFGNVTFSSDPCVGSGSAKTEEGFAARERFENYNWQNKLRNSASSIHWLSSSIFTVCSFVPHR